VDRLCHFRFRGRLVSRGIEGAVIKDPERVAERALKMALENKVTAIDGTVIELRAETLCVHGDTPGAVQLVKSIRELLEAEGVTVEPMSCNGVT